MSLCVCITGLPTFAISAPNGLFNLSFFTPTKLIVKQFSIAPHLSSAFQLLHIHNAFIFTLSYVILVLSYKIASTFRLMLMGKCTSALLSHLTVLPVCLFCGGKQFEF